VVSTVNNVCLMDGPLFQLRLVVSVLQLCLRLSKLLVFLVELRVPIVSIIPINGINMGGVPWGTKCSNMWLVFLIHPTDINLIHIGRARVNVSVRCLVLVKMHGNSPKKLFVKIIRNNDVRNM
jgi:hypothetical protein